MPIYKGRKEWAPCLHTNRDQDGFEHEIEVQSWANDVLSKPWLGTAFTAEGFSLAKRERHPAQVALEIIGEICYGHIPSCFWDIRLEFYSDMWVGVYCKATYTKAAWNKYNLGEYGLPDYEEFWTEADDFTLGLIKTAERIQDIMDHYPIIVPEDWDTYG